MTEYGFITAEEHGVIATGVSLEEYMERYAQKHCEWVDGEVIALTPAEIHHNHLIYYLWSLFDAYFYFRPIGIAAGQPFPMRLPAFPKRRREPDLMIVLNTNPNQLTDTLMDGAPDICIEVVSPESGERDHGEKFIEYETGGVPEYWILDPLRHESRFYRLGDGGLYVRQSLNENEEYQTITLPELRLHVPTLWQEKLPSVVEISRTIEAMLR